MSLNTTDILIARIYLTESSDVLDEIIEYLRDDAKIRGFSTNCDGYDRIEPDPAGTHLALAIEEALEDAEFSKDSIDYILGNFCRPLQA